jgi:hypothetical protein
MHDRAPLSSTALLLYALPALPLSAAALPVYVHLPNLYAQRHGVPLAALGGVLLLTRAEIKRGENLPQSAHA